MGLLAAESLIAARTLSAGDPIETIGWITRGLMVKSFLPAAWLGFSFTYSRGDSTALLLKWKYPLAIAAVLPVLLTFTFQDRLLALDTEASLLRFSGIGATVNVVLLVTKVLVLMNLEQTFRSAVGVARWRIKYVVLGLAIIFGARLYVRSEAILFSAYDPGWSAIEASGLLIGCCFLAVAYLRAGLAGIEVYPSRAVLGSSVTVLLAGGYLLTVGLLARVVERIGGPGNLQFQAFAVLLGMALLAVLLLSDKLRQRIHSFIGRHFARAQHDSVQIWTAFSRRLANVKDESGLCSEAVKLVSETFEVLSVTIWLFDEQADQLVARASTSSGESKAASANIAAGLRGKLSPFDLEDVNAAWAEELRQLNPSTFPTGGNRWCVPLTSGERVLGAFVLADRVNGAAYTAEQTQLLECIADQVTSVLLNLRLASEVARSRELEAFRTMSAFFVHDLKNAAASLSLMLKNLPAHFDDPAFRQDALRAVGNSVDRIEGMISRLSALRDRPRFSPRESDLNQLVIEALDGLQPMANVELIREFEPLPKIMADPEQLSSVITNLVLNARDALAAGGWIRVGTMIDGENVVLSVADNGCGMSAAFLRDSLFRPFQSTKRGGLGIGMYQSRIIVEAHGGNIRAQSEPGKGATFRVSLPVSNRIKDAP